jgi:hypothetical protein
MRRTILLGLVMLIGVGWLGSASMGSNMIAWHFVSDGGVTWVQPVVSAQLTSAECKQYIPTVDYSYDPIYNWPNVVQTGSEKLAYIYHRAESMVRPLLIFGHARAIPECEAYPIGWATAWAVAYSPYGIYWATADHAVNTLRYYPDAQADDWYIRATNGENVRAILKGCKKDKYCILETPAMYVVPFSSLNLAYITNEAQLFDQIFAFGCSGTAKVVAPGHFKVLFFCFGNQGFVNSRYAAGEDRNSGDLLISNPIMEGMSGGPVFIWPTGVSKPMIIGIINARADTVGFVDTVDPDTALKLQALAYMEKNLFDTQTPEFKFVQQVKLP